MIPFHLPLMGDINQGNPVCKTQKSHPENISNKWSVEQQHVGLGAAPTAEFHDVH